MVSLSPIGASDENWTDKFSNVGWLPLAPRKQDDVRSSFLLQSIPYSNQRLYIATTATTEEIHALTGEGVRGLAYYLLVCNTHTSKLQPSDKSTSSSRKALASSLTGTTVEL